MTIDKVIYLFCGPIFEKTMKQLWNAHNYLPSNGIYFLADSRITIHQKLLDHTRETERVRERNKTNLTQKQFVQLSASYRATKPLNALLYCNAVCSD